MADKGIYDFDMKDIKKYYFSDLKENQIEKIRFVVSEEEKIYQKIKDIYEKFLSSELPKISTDIDEEESGLKKVVINTKITKIYG